MKLCPCGSLQHYTACCGLYLEQGNLPETPEQLMRSRYTAFTREDWDYIKNTMKGKALSTFNEHNNQSPHLWITLKIIHCHQETPDTGSVEFIASYLKNSHIQAIHEKSEFRREAEKWFYIDGIHYPCDKQAVSRNNPCPCGSLKKFKNCHG